MISVWLNSKQEAYNFTSLENKFLQICKEHKETGRALVFAFILYDFENAQIAKVLRDDDYWVSLNAISGEYLTVFSLNYKPEIKRRSKSRNSEGPVLYNLTSINHFSNPSEGSNILIEKYFGKDIKVKYPAVLFFQIHKDIIIDYTLIQLDEETIEQAFLELKKYISVAVGALKKVKSENRNNSQAIFNLVESEVKGLRLQKTAAKNFRKFTKIAELGATIVGLG